MATIGEIIDRVVERSIATLRIRATFLEVPDFETRALLLTEEEQRRILERIERMRGPSMEIVEEELRRVMRSFEEEFRRVMRGEG